MKQPLIFALLSAISLLGIKLQAQVDSLHVEAKTEIREVITDSIGKHAAAGNLFIGVDLFSPVMSAFTNKKGGQAMLSYRVYKKWNVVFEAGYEQNNFDQIDWNVDVDGVYFKVGFNWFASQDSKNPSNGFYLGARFAYTIYNQEIKQYPIRFSNHQVSEYGSLPKAAVSAYWMELLGGARVHLWQGFYADVSVRPEIYLGSKKQENIDPLVIPGYGRDQGVINFSVFWGITYKLF